MLAAIGGDRFQVFSREMLTPQESRGLRDDSAIRNLPKENPDSQRARRSPATSHWGLFWPRQEPRRIRDSIRQAVSGGG